MDKLHAAGIPVPEGLQRVMMFEAEFYAEEVSHKVVAPSKNGGVK